MGPWGGPGHAFTVLDRAGEEKIGSVYKSTEEEQEG